MRVIYSPRYEMDIGSHVFPTQKYRLVHTRLLETGVVRSSQIVEATPASWDDLSLVHSPEYLDKTRRGGLTADELAQLELPWSVPILDGFRTMVGGTVEAARIACGLDVAIQDCRLSVHLGGGLHHAFASHGEGFCPFNDVAVAARALQSRGVDRVAIVDLDVHHGNGTAFIFESDPRVFTFSMHQQDNYPIWKPRSSLDIGLPDGTADAAYLDALERSLPKVMAADPQCVFYLAGADPYEDDRLGGLRLTMEGLRRRDRMVFDVVRLASVPLVVVLAGGYARRVEDTVAIHVATIDEAVQRLENPPTQNASPRH